MLVGRGQGWWDWIWEGSGLDAVVGLELGWVGMAGSVWIGSGVIRDGHVQSSKGRDWSISVLINQALVRGCRVWF